MERSEKSYHAKVQVFLDKMPESGIGFHGTSVANAELILNEGVRAEYAKDHGLIFYNLFFPFKLGTKQEHPIPESNNWKYQFERFEMQAIAPSVTYAYRRTEYSNKDKPFTDPQRRKAVVALIPPQGSHFVSDDELAAEGRSLVSVPQENIIGYVEIPREAMWIDMGLGRINTRIRRTVMMDVVKMLDNHFSSSEPQLPDLG